MSKIRFGIDLGGTKIEIIALADDGRIAHRQRIATPAMGGEAQYRATIQAIAAAAVATWVLVIAAPARALEPTAEPALNPNQPTHRRLAPIMV